MKKISIITLGCAKNQNDTENLAGLLQKGGYDLEKDPAQAEAIVIHTCSFIEAAKKESVATILEAAQLKSPSAKLIVTGCMVQQHGKEMMEELPEVDAFLGTGQLPQVLDYLAHPKPRFMDRRDPGGLVDPDAPRLLETKGASATLRLSEGCSHPCSFCVIPKLRGSLTSRPEEVILKEAHTLLDQGIQELVLIGQDTGDWGRDRTDGKRLPHLLRSLREIKGLRWIRLMYMHPYSFSAETMEVLSESPEIFPYLDMPLQHIDDLLLKDMKRYLGEVDLRRLIDNVHQRLPHISLRTTFIVGYPGEKDRQFEKLHQFVTEGHFDYMGAFAYSREENTPAGVHKKQLSDRVKEERLKSLQDAQFLVSEKKSKLRLGSTETILIDDLEGDAALGRTSREAPEIDAVVKLPGSLGGPGTFIQAKLTGYDAYEFTAEPAFPSP